METEEFKNLIQDGQSEQAQKWLEDFLAANVSPQMQARTLLELTSFYLEVKNNMDREYLEVLKLAIAEVSAAQKQLNQEQDELGLAEARQALS